MRTIERGAPLFVPRIKISTMPGEKVDDLRMTSSKLTDHRKCMQRSRPVGHPLIWISTSIEQEVDNISVPLNHSCLQGRTFHAGSVDVGAPFEQQRHCICLPL